MYITKSIIEGLKILGFDKETITKVSKERSLEEIFLSTLFLNYFIVLIVYMISLILGGLKIEGRELHMPVVFGLLMIYPFVFNITVYAIYGFFASMAELLNTKIRTKPLISVGFHTAIVYSIIIYMIGLLSTFNLSWAGFLFAAFMIYFIYTMFLAISIIYEYSLGQTLIVIFVPFLLLGTISLISMMLFPGIFQLFLGLIFQ